MTHPVDPDGNALDSLLSLEDQYYTEGYDLGVADGARAGRIEGRIFGLEKGFEKFLELGRLAGRADVWQSRLPADSGADVTTKPARSADECSTVSAIEASERLRKHINRLCDLTDTSYISTENSEEAVEDFDNRLKDSRAKATLISKAVGEDGRADHGTYAIESNVKASHSGSLRLKQASRNESSQKRSGRAGGEMEDFEGVLPISNAKRDHQNGD